MNELTEITVSCPYCAEPLSLLLDGSDGEQEYFEDCQVCCRPILVSFDVAADSSPQHIRVRREDDA